MSSEFVAVVPVLPSANIDRDLAWYQSNLGFEPAFADRMYAGVRRGGAWIHLQWHADTPSDPLNAGSVVRLFVPDIEPWFAEFCQRGVLRPTALRRHTPWGTHEFGLHDLNGNAIFLVEDLAPVQNEPPL